jgi:hypothetical protein
MKRRMQRGMFAVATAAALGFGAAQAFASPGGAAARACDLAQCDAACKARGATGGYCQMGWCGCYVDLPPAG